MKERTIIPQIGYGVPLGFILFCFVIYGCWSQKASKFNGDTFSPTVPLAPLKTNFDSAFSKPRIPLMKFPDSLSYSHTLAEVARIRRSYADRFKKEGVALEEVMSVFQKQLVQKIIPYWYGTMWSFNGYTAIPGRGSIACGYFVATTLRDAGLNLNRYRLAQWGPLDEAKALSQGALISVIHADKVQEVRDTINTLTTEGLYFIGFDKGHVGFLLKMDGSLFLIHSNYLHPVSVVVEPLETARVLGRFRKFYLLPISHNADLVRAWLSGRALF